MHLGLPVKAAVGVVYFAAAALAGIGVVLGEAGSVVHVAGVIVLGVVGLVTLAVFFLMPVYGDSLDARMSRTRNHQWDVQGASPDHRPARVRSGPGQAPTRLSGRLRDPS